MRVRVVESRQDRGAACVDRFGFGSAQLSDIRRGADGDDAIAADRECLFESVAAVSGVDRAVEDDEIRGRDLRLLVRAEHANHDDSEHRDPIEHLSYFSPLAAGPSASARHLFTRVTADPP